MLDGCSSRLLLPTSWQIVIGALLLWLLEQPHHRRGVVPLQMVGAASRCGFLQDGISNRSAGRIARRQHVEAEEEEDPPHPHVVVEVEEGREHLS